MATKQTRAKAKPAERQIRDSQQRSATWVDGMREHFQQTGYYRAEDLEQLLGDPRQPAESSSIPSMLFCASDSK
jgi:hypothetical protein